MGFLLLGFIDGSFARAAWARDRRPVYHSGLARMVPATTVKADKNKL
jgi:hypothetical protein